MMIFALPLSEARIRKAVRALLSGEKVLIGQRRIEMEGPLMFGTDAYGTAHYFGIPSEKHCETAVRWATALAHEQLSSTPPNSPRVRRSPNAHTSVTQPAGIE